MSAVQKCTHLSVAAALSIATLSIPMVSTAAWQRDDALLENGQRLYSQYCRSCHGDRATGDGPAATALKVRPADLTWIAEKHGGFPTEKVMYWIDGEKYAVGHGSREMPVWGKRFRRSAGSDKIGENEVYALTEYLRSIQQK